METTWIIVLILLLITSVVSLRWYTARSMAAKSQTDLAATQTKLKDALVKLDSVTIDLEAANHKVVLLTSRVNDLETEVEADQFTPDCVYILLAKGEVSRSGSGDSEPYVVVEDNSGFVRAFLTGEILEHLEVGDCFGNLLGKLTKLDPSEFQLESDPKPTAASDSESEWNDPLIPSSMHAIASDPKSVSSISEQGIPSKTAVFIPPETPQEPQDPTIGLPYFTFLEGENQGEVVHLEFDKLIAGRDPDNDIIIQDDSASRVHFVVTFTDNRFLLKDNDSTNGTICNGEKIKQRWLEFGDKIQVGSTALIFSCEGFDLKDDNPEKAVVALEACIQRQPDFVTALKILAFMLERNIARRKEAASIWEKIARLEKSA